MATLLTSSSTSFRPCWYLAILYPSMNWSHSLFGLEHSSVFQVGLFRGFCLSPSLLDSLMPLWLPLGAHW